MEDSLKRPNMLSQLSSSKKRKSDEDQDKEIVPQLYKKETARKIPLEHNHDFDQEVNISDTKAALLLIKDSFPTELFRGRLPPIVLYCQLESILHNRHLIDTELSQLVKTNEVITFSTFTTLNYLIVFTQDFVNLPRDGIFKRFVDEVLVPRCEQDSDSNKDHTRVTAENSKYFSRESLLKQWKFKEDEVRLLVNNGYLAVKESGYYCASLPSAGEFMKVFNKGRKTVLNAVKKAKFGEILQAVRNFFF